MTNLPNANQLILVKNHAYLVVMIVFRRHATEETYICFRDGVRTDFTRSELNGATVVDSSGAKEQWKRVEL